ncbi:MAG: M48 family metallopeptidase [Myxococcota bacterium]|nr:M48 family metallopeptidase [Myxococcota bacterium]
MRDITLWLVGLVVLQGCGGALISNQQEREIGAGVDKQLRKEYRLVHSKDPVAKWAKELVAPLERASVRFRDPKEVGGYKVAVIADNELVNAFAAPGGYTYLSTGLILQSKTCAEIAGVMGHELAHVTQRHGAKSIESSFAVEQIVSFFLSDGLAAGSAVLIWQFLSSTTFSRDDENEADTVGLQITYGAGYNPDGLADFFRILLKAEKGASAPEFLSSHPATSKRIRSVKRQIRKRYGASIKRKSTKCRTRMKLAEVKRRIESGKLRLGPKPVQKKTARADAIRHWKTAVERFKAKSKAN